MTNFFPRLLLVLLCAGYHPVATVPIDFMRSAVERRERFFLYLPYYLVHETLEPKPAYLKYLREKYGQELAGETLKVLAMISSLDGGVGRPGELGWASVTTAPGRVSEGVGQYRP